MATTWKVTASEDDCDETNGGIVEDSDVAMVCSTLMYGCGVIFRNITIPKGSTINSAVLRARFGYGCATAPNCTIYFYGVDEDTCDDWADVKPSETNKTTANAGLFIDQNFAPNHLYTTEDIDVVDIVQEIVNRDGWSSGNDMGFIIKTQGTWCKLCKVSFNTYDYSTTANTDLIVDWTEPAGTNTQINISDSWKEIASMQINIGDAWKEITSAQINISDSWKSIY